MSDEPRVLAEFTDYESLRQALNAVREQKLDISLELLDQITGAPQGYFSKILGPGQPKKLGLQSLGWALGGLGIKCIIVEDPAALARIKSRLQPRDRAHLRRTPTIGGHHIITWKFLKQISKLGVAARAAKLSKKKQRSAIARKAAIKRWAKRRAAPIE